jgi:hypothetical protein
MAHGVAHGPKSKTKKKKKKLRKFGDWGGRTTHNALGGGFEPFGHSHSLLGWLNHLIPAMTPHFGQSHLFFFFFLQFF